MTQRTPEEAFANSAAWEQLGKGEAQAARNAARLRQRGVDNVSVQTTADTILDQVDRDLGAIMRDMSPVVTQATNVWGADGYSVEYQLTLIEVYKSLLSARTLLNR